MRLINKMNSADKDGRFVTLNLDEAEKLLDSGCDLIKFERNRNGWEFVFCLEDELKSEREEENVIINRTVKRIVRNSILDEIKIEEILDRFAEKRYNYYKNIKNNLKE